MNKKVKIETFLSDKTEDVINLKDFQLSNQFVNDTFFVV